MKLGINLKVVAAMFLVVLSTMLVIAFYSHSMTKDILIEQVEKELSLSNEKVKNTVSSVFEQKGEIVRQLSSIPVIKSFMSASENREDVRANKDYEWLQQALTHAEEKNADVQQFWLAHLENSYSVTDHDYVTDASFLIEERPWFTESTSKEGLHFSPPYTDYVTNQLTISITYPVVVENKKLGYLGLDMHLDGLASLLKPLETENQKLVLVSKQGDVLYDSGEMWPTLREVQLEGKGIVKVQKEEENYYVSTRNLEELDWKVVVYVPEEVMLQPLVTYEKSIIMIWITAIIILLTALSLVLHYFLKDIPFIVRQINKIKYGDMAIKMGIQRKDEVGEIAWAVDQMALQIKSQMDELEYQANYDSLTGLANRHSIERVLGKWLAEIENSDEMMAVVFFDLDQFKHVNDSKGHAFGDELLIEVGRRISEVLPQNSFFGRFGGDEFVFIMRVKKEAIHEIDRSLQQIHASFSKSFLLFGQSIHITASLGVSMYPTDAQTITELFIAADTALYHAKEQGRNRIAFFNREMKEQIQKELRLKDGLRQALLNDEFFLHYQPQLDMASGKTTSIEALIRWKNPQLGMISPADFIPLAETTGQIIAIGDWVIEEVLQMIKRLDKRALGTQRVAVNVSAIQLREADFVDKLRKKLADYDVEPSLLEIEITESITIKYPKETIRKLVELKELGIQITLDDFGTGYSSLNYLRTMPIDCVKVDRSFIQRIEKDNVEQGILETIITLGHKLGFQIVAEGIEEEAQLEILQDMKVDTVQGYYYSRPLDEESLIAFIREKETIPDTQ